MDYVEIVYYKTKEHSEVVTYLQQARDIFKSFLSLNHSRIKLYEDHHEFVKT
jgi:hypothetical protein